MPKKITKYDQLEDIADNENPQIVVPQNNNNPAPQQPPPAQNQANVTNQNLTLQTKIKTIASNICVNRKRRVVLIILLFLLANLVYYSIQANCPTIDEQHCLNHFILQKLKRSWIPAVTIISILFTSGVIIVLKSKDVRNIWLIIPLINIILLTKNLEVSNIHYQGAINLLLILVLFGISIIVVKMYLIIKVVSKLPKKTQLIGALLLVLFTIVALFFDDIRYCHKHVQDINGNVYDAFSVNECNIMVSDKHKHRSEKLLTPHSYERKIIHSNKQRKSKTQYIDFSTLNEYRRFGNFLAYPRTENFSEHQRLLTNFRQRTLNQISIIANESVLNQTNKEIFLNLTDLKNPQFIINVNKNNILSHNRSEIAEKAPISLAKNLIIFYIEDFPRNLLKVEMPQTTELLQNISKEHQSQHDSIEFLRYHANGRQEEKNMLELLFGEESSILNQNSVNIIEQFKNNGFVTASVMDHCSNPSYIKNYQHMHSGVNYPRFDHEASAFSCNLDKDYNEQKSMNILERIFFDSKSDSIYGQDKANISLKYAKDFWSKYSHNKKLLFTHFKNSHEGVDQELYNFLTHLKQEDELEQTAFLFISDHSLKVDDAFHIFDSEHWKISRSLPLLYLSLPFDHDNDNDFYNQIARNKEKLVHSRNVHDFLLDFAAPELRNKNNSESLMDFELSSNRNCFDVPEFREVDRILYCGCR